MKKGNFGIRLAAYGVVAFFLAYMGAATLLFLLLGVALLAEKNEWTVRQILQALVLCYVASIVRSIFGIVDFIGKIPLLGTLWNVLTGIVYGVVDLAVLVCAIVGIIRNLKDEDASIPVARKFADWVCGAANKAVVTPAKAVEQKEEA